MKEKEIREKIIGGAYTVYNTMGFGFLESVYENCLKIELDEANIPYQSQEPVQVTYKNQIVGDFVPDLLVGEDLIVELKSVRALNSKHETQVVNYLKATGISTGLLINFGENSVEVKKKYRDKKAFVKTNG